MRANMRFVVIGEVVAEKHDSPFTITMVNTSVYTMVKRVEMAERHSSATTSPITTNLILARI